MRPVHAAIKDGDIIKRALVNLGSRVGLCKSNQSWAVVGASFYMTYLVCRLCNMLHALLLQQRYRGTLAECAMCV